MDGRLQRPASTSSYKRANPLPMHREREDTHMRVSETHTHTDLHTYSCATQNMARCSVQLRRCVVRVAGPSVANRGLS
jgi:hypothetical protein